MSEPVSPSEPAPRPRWRRRVALALVVAGLTIIAMFGLTWLQRTLLFPREALRAIGPPSTPGFERWWLDSPDGPVEAWLLLGDGVDEAHPGPAVVFAHGNGELIDHWPGLLAPYRALGVSVVLAEYRGYGRSAGRPSEDAITEDLRTLYARVVAHPAIDPERLVYHGRSLGGGAIGTLVRAHPPRALILESTFTSVVDVAGDLRIPAFLIVDRFETLEALRTYRGPVLLFHGVNDGVVPVGHGRRLAASLENAELVLYDSGHNDLPPPGSDYWSRIERFLRQSGVR